MNGQKMQKRFSLPTVLLPAILLCSIPSAMATEWTSIIKNNDYEVLVDIDSYNVEDNAPYMTTKTIFNKPQTYALSNKKFQYSTSIINIQFNCAEPQYKTKSIALYDKKNKLLALEKELSEFKKIEANTQEFSIGQLTCQVHQMLGGQ
jgi:surface-adhesin protein E